MIARITCCNASAPQTFEDLATKFLQSLPKGYARYNIVADTYREYQISREKKVWNFSKSANWFYQKQITKRINKFMLNNDNKNPS